MICYRCEKVYTCDWVRFANKENFEISKCANFSEIQEFKYKRIAEHDELMKLIYDYFTDRVEGHSDEETKEVLTRVMMSL